MRQVKPASANVIGNLSDLESDEEEEEEDIRQEEQHMLKNELR